MGDLVVRSFTESDAPHARELWDAVFADDPPWNEPDAVIRRKLGIQRELFLVGELDGRLVATLVGGYDGFRGWAYHLAVDAAHRRRGFGRAMMRELEVRLRELGCPKLNLQVRSSNASAVAFYRALGYAVEERVSLGRLLDRASAGADG
jgi:ribosomal protein S18 acetylase RimI-like enzyme